MDREKATYHIGITYTTNMRFWEFNEDFKARLKTTKAQGVEMECATLFSASYKRKFTLGALLLVSDLPLDQEGIKTKQSSQWVFDNCMANHIENGVKVLKLAREMQSKQIKGAYHRNLDDD
jgi:AMP nucleosidase